VVVWDVPAITAADLTWISLLTAHRPARAVVVLESFPRADTTRAALEAGAVAVLGRPVSMEALSGVLLGDPAAGCG
jgi:DNA-binding NarL/FixJ family response regulator